MKRRTLTLFALVVGLAASAVPAHADSWNGYHWKHQTAEAHVKVVSLVTSDWDSAVATAIGDWSDSDVVDMDVSHESASSAARKKCKAVKGQITVCNFDWGDNGWMGDTAIQTKGKHITSATVRLNDHYMRNSLAQIWRNLNACHELGHAIGLDHQDENFKNVPLGTCLDYTIAPIPNQHPNLVDYNSLDETYSHTDSTASAAKKKHKRHNRDRVPLGVS